MEKRIEVETKYAKAQMERDTHLEKVLNSKAKKKIIVGGPGTGKTYLFKKLLEKKNNSLALTFVNSLVDDLSLELCGLSEVKTLHGFARSTLSRITKEEIKIFPKLSKIIEDDAKILLDKKIEFDKIFHERDDGNEFIEFYRKRKKYFVELYFFIQ
jgi:Cdc6-like AAA superfamily ATPase